MARARPEDAVQADIVGFLRAVLSPTETLVYANANASRRTAAGRASNGVPGLLPGIPDLSIVSIGGRVFFIEVKAPKGVPSEPQRAVMDRFVRMGVPHAVCRSIDDVRAALAAWGLRTREAA